QQKIILEKPYTFYEGEKKLTPIEVRARLEKIPDSDCELFGINPSTMRPEWAVLTIFPIPPVTMRPSITLESGERSEDDLTHKLGDIVRINQRLFENINAGAPEIIIEDLWDLLKYHITTFFNNEVAQLPPARHRSGQPLTTITERIKSKEGRIRYNLAGKRTNFSARTVISPDPMIKLNEVGIPFVIATKLTVPERVTTWNIDYLKEFVRRGSKNYPGANYIIRPDGKKKRVTEETKEMLLEEIQPGYVVERHLMDGDIAIFNRQPSLHRMSMMCHKVKVLPGRTFRMNPAVCNPYNADFDGDEMNLHIPQTEEARAEAEILMQVETQLVSPGYGLSVMGCIHDSVSGLFLLTKDLSFKKRDAVMLLLKSGIEDLSRLPDKEIIEGKEIFSVILPQDFSFSGHSKLCKKKVDNCEDPNHVVIKKGKLIQGVLDSANIGKGEGRLLRELHQKYGENFAADFLTKASQLGINVLFFNGFTASLSDTDLPEVAKQKIKEVVDSAYDTIKELINAYESGNLESFPGKTAEETLELKILEALNKARNKTGSIVTEYATKETNTIIMAKSGARGSLLNLAQIAACIGQQAFRGKRISHGFKGRTISVFKKKDLSAQAHGFIRDGYKLGMEPHEFFFSAMTGRDSLMDTALRTPKSGYLYRRLSNAMQDLKVEYDNTVRDASGKIIQFSYGEDGVDVSRSVGGEIDVKKLIRSVLES
ncbi:MAG: DNA-directed RNA polymerase subunit A', partial [Candidatus Woesearchaeota archaeon]